MCPTRISLCQGAQRECRVVTERLPLNRGLVLTGSSLELRVLQAAEAKANELGFSSDRFRRQVFRQLRPVDEPFLDQEEVTERSELWAINYAPHPPAENVAMAGGDLTIYVDVRTISVVAVWLGE